MIHILIFTRRHRLHCFIEPECFSSMIGETFFSEVTQNNRRGHGTVSCQEFGHFVGNAIEQVQIRLNPERYC